MKIKKFKIHFGETDDQEKKHKKELEEEKSIVVAEERVLIKTLKKTGKTLNEQSDPLMKELELQLADAVDQLYGIFTHHGMDYLGWDYKTRDAHWVKFKRMLNTSNKLILKKFEKQIK